MTAIPSPITNVTALYLWPVPSCIIVSYADSNDWCQVLWGHLQDVYSVLQKYILQWIHRPWQNIGLLSCSLFSFTLSALPPIPYDTRQKILQTSRPQDDNQFIEAGVKGLSWTVNLFLMQLIIDRVEGHTSTDIQSLPIWTSPVLARLIAFPWRICSRNAGHQGGLSYASNFSVHVALMFFFCISFLPFFPCLDRHFRYTLLL